MGYFVLQGGAEFGGMMSASDRLALELAGGKDVPVKIIPAAAAPDNNHHRAGEHGRRWFHAIGASSVEVLPLVDKASANSANLASELEAARLIYLLGGFPGYLMDTLNGSAACLAISSALNNGAVVAGSSAGAMVLCGHFYDPQKKTVVDGLAFLPSLCILPHHNRFGAHWVNRLQKARPYATLIGIDEETGMISDSKHHRWRVHGGGGVTVYGKDRKSHYRDNDVVQL